MNKAINKNQSMPMQVLCFAVPLMIANVLQLLFNAADLAVVGRFCGAMCLAAVGASSNIVNLMVGFFNGVATGSSICVAQGRGARDDERISRSVHTSISLAVLLGVFATVVGFIISTPLLRATGVPEELIDMASLYLKIYFAGMIPAFVTVFAAACIRAMGDSRLPMIYISLAGALNVVLNVIFVVFFNMDVDGVALATSLSKVLSAFLSLRHLCKRTDAARLSLKKLTVDSKTIGTILRLGIPGGITASTFSISNLLMQSGVNGFGSVVMSGVAAATSINSLSNGIIEAFNATALNLIGYYYGAGDLKKMWKNFRVNFVICTGFALTSIALLYFFCVPLLRIFLGSDTAPLPYGIIKIKQQLPFYVFYGFYSVIIGTLRGVGNVKSPTVCSIIFTCGLRVIWRYAVFPLFGTLQALIWAWPISWIVTFIAVSIALYRHAKKNNLFVARQPSGSTAG